MSNEYYDSTGTPATGSFGSSSLMRAQFNLIEAGFDKFPTLSGNAGRVWIVDPTGTSVALTTGALALAGNLTTTGAFSTTLAQVATVTLTLPAANGTLLTTAGSGASLTGITAGQISGLATVATTGSASDLGSGTLPTARLSGSYTGITAVGTIATGVWNGTIITSAYGGTGNGFTKFSGPTTTEKTFTLPDGSTTVITTGYTAAVTVGYTFTAYSLGNITSFTVNPALGNYQYGTNHGAFTLTAPASDCSVVLLLTNDATAGAITFSGFTTGSSTGDTLTTTNTSKFMLSILRINGVSTYLVKALQA